MEVYYKWDSYTRVYPHTYVTPAKEQILRLKEMNK